MYCRKGNDRYIILSNRDVLPEVGVYYTPEQDALNLVCSGSVVVTAYDFKSDRPGSNPEGG